MTACRTRSALLAAGFCLVSAVVRADVYLWRDAQGAAKYSYTLPEKGARDVERLRTTVKFFATFGTSPFKTATGNGTSHDGVWWVEQKAGTNRASIVNIGRDGGTALRLHTEPGDSNVSGSGTNERNDVALPRETTGCEEGREQWWEHSILFPEDYVSPPAGPARPWYALSGFHHSGPTGQGNFTLYDQPGVGLVFGGFGGATVARDPSHPGYFTAVAGPVAKNVWYDFVYHVKWSSGSEGSFEAWVNGVQKLAHHGPTLYKGMGCYLKLANYHTAFGRASSVIYDRVIRLDVVDP
ncbi:MAG: heparin lyase I family protein [Burkholderiales bacterium]